MNEFRLGIQPSERYACSAQRQHDREFPSSSVSKAYPQGNSNGGLGSIYFGSLNSLGSSQYLPSIELSTTSQITDNLTKIVWAAES